MAHEHHANGTGARRWATVRIAAGCAIAVVLAAAAPASAQDSRDVQALTQKIERLQGELNDLQRRVYGDESASSQNGDNGGNARADADAGTTDWMTQSAGRRLRERMGALENDLRRLTGQLQQTRHELQKATKRLDKLVQDVDYRLRELENFKTKAAAQLEALTSEGGGNGAGSDDGTGQSDGARPADAGGDDGQVAASSGTTDGGNTDGSTSSGANANKPSGNDDGGGGTIGTVSESAVNQLRKEAEQSGGSGQQGDGGARDGETRAGDAQSDNDATDTEATDTEATDTEATDDKAAGDTQTAAKPSGSNVLPDAPPQAQYEHAFKLLRERDYAKAEKAMKAFVDAHPKHKLAGNAKYWLGETYYVRGEYNQAAVVFAEGFRSYPDSRKAPDNLLKLGITLAKIDKVDKACRLFSELQKRFPDAAQNIRHRAERERERLGCSSGS